MPTPSIPTRQGCQTHVECILWHGILPLYHAAARARNSKLFEPSRLILPPNAAVGYSFTGLLALEGLILPDPIDERVINNVYDAGRMNWSAYSFREAAGDRFRHLRPQSLAPARQQSISLPNSDYSSARELSQKRRPRFACVPDEEYKNHGRADHHHSPCSCGHPSPSRPCSSILILSFFLGQCYSRPLSAVSVVGGLILAVPAVTSLGIPILGRQVDRQQRSCGGLCPR